MITVPQGFPPLSVEQRHQPVQHHLVGWCQNALGQPLKAITGGAIDWGTKNYGLNYGALFTAWGMGGFVMGKVSEMINAQPGGLGQIMQVKSV